MARRITLPTARLCAPTARGRDLSEGGKYGPLGAGHDPAKDPLKGLRGVMSGTLIMRAISVLLGLTGHAHSRRPDQPDLLGDITSPSWAWL